MSEKILLVFEGEKTDRKSCIFFILKGFIKNIIVGVNLSFQDRFVIYINPARCAGLS